MINAIDAYARRITCGDGLEPFDAAQALHWYCVDYHSGQWSDLYSIQCRLGYRPGAIESNCDNNPMAAEVYLDLVAGHIDAGDLLAWIDAYEFTGD